MSNKSIPLCRPDIRKEDISEVIRVLKTGMLVQGVEVKKLESDVSKLFQIEYCSVVSNGTASLQMALIALGIGPGDEVIVPALSYIATANVVELVGAKCVFVDTNPRYFNIEESKIEQVITKKTKAIIPVHEFGLCANMPEIMKIAMKHKIKVIEDSACAIGATYLSRFAGSFGDFGSFSLHPRKAITSGEGGLLITSDFVLDKKIKTLRNHGIEPDSVPMNFIAAGFNYRMTDFQAALVNSQLKRLTEIIAVKNRLATIYLSEIKHKGISLPEIPVEAKHTWQTFHIMLESNSIREKIAAYLKDHMIFTNYGAQCIPATQYFSEKYKHNPGEEFPNAFQAFKCGLAIPMYDRLAEKQVYRIARIINKFK